MARVAVVFADLLLGSNFLGMVNAAGHEGVLVAQPPADGDADVAIVDLASFPDAPGLSQTKTIGVYSHVDVETKARAEAAGYDLVVPRSRMAREGAQLVERVLSGA